MTKVIRGFGIRVHDFMQGWAKGGERAKENDASECAAEDGSRNGRDALAIHYVHLTKDEAGRQDILPNG